MSHEATCPLGIAHRETVRVEWEDEEVVGVVDDHDCHVDPDGTDGECFALIAIPVEDADRLGACWCDVRIRASFDGVSWSDPVVHVPLDVDEYGVTCETERIDLTEIQVVDSDRE